MELVFNDATRLKVQSVATEGDTLIIKTVSASPEELRTKFEDEFATKRMWTEERGQKGTVYEQYTALDHLRAYTGGINAVAMMQVDKTPEMRAEIQEAAIEVARLQAQTLTDAQALSVKAIYPVWSGEAVQYTAGMYMTYNDVLYKVLQDHTSQGDWTPDTATSLYAKVLVDPSGTILPWEQPDSTNAYQKGDKVTHKDKIWTSLVDGNVWEPGEVGTETVWKEE